MAVVEDTFICRSDTALSQAGKLLLQPEGTAEILQARNANTTLTLPCIMNTGSRKDHLRDCREYFVYSAVTPRLKVLHCKPAKHFE